MAIPYTAYSKCSLLIISLRCNLTYVVHQLQIIQINNINTFSNTKVIENCYTFIRHNKTLSGQNSILNDYLNIQM